MPQLLYQPRGGLIPFAGNQDWKQDPNRRIYSERQWGALRSEEWFRDDSCIVYQLGAHDLTAEIQHFRGWTPAIEFEISGFKLEEKIDLLNVGREIPLESLGGGSFQIGTSQQGGVRVKEVTVSDLEYGRKNAGTVEVLDKHCERIVTTFQRLNEQGTEFVTFRTYRGGPAVWDYVYFFSQGQFQF